MTYLCPCRNNWWLIGLSLAVLLSLSWCALLTWGQFVRDEREAVKPTVSHTVIRVEGDYTVIDTIPNGGFDIREGIMKEPEKKEGGKK